MPGWPTRASARWRGRHRRTSGLVRNTVRPGMPDPTPGATTGRTEPTTAIGGSRRAAVSRTVESGAWATAPPGTTRRGMRLSARAAIVARRGARVRFMAFGLLHDSRHGAQPSYELER